MGAGGGAPIGVAVVAHLLWWLVTAWQLVGDYLVRVVAGRGGVVGLGRIASLLHVAGQLGKGRGWEGGQWRPHLVKGIRVGVVRLGVGGLPPAWRTGNLEEK